MPTNPARKEIEFDEEQEAVANLIAEKFLQKFGHFPNAHEIRVMQVGLEVSIEWAKRKEAAARDFKPGDIVENLLNPSLDYRAVVNVGDDWLTILLPGGESSPFPKANYRVVNPIE